MDFLVFAQRPEPRVPLVELLQNAQRYFATSINVLFEEQFERTTTEPERSRVQLEVSNTKRNYKVRIQLVARPRTDADLALAREAEARSQSGGMATLAERCPSVWEVSAGANAPDVARYELCAVLASTALGPVMPKDASTLFGVRGALERAAHAHG